MKIHPVLCGAIVLFSACSDMLSIFELPETFEPPQTIAIIGEPAYSVNLGPLNKGDPYTLEFLGFDMSSLGEGFGDGIKVYDYDYPNPDIKTLLLHYPLDFDMGDGTSVSTDDFDAFNDPIPVPPLTLAIPKIEPLSISLSLSIPTGGLPVGSTIPPVSIPLSPPAQTVDLSAVAGFEKATIKSGDLLVTVPDEVDFSGMGIIWAGVSLGAPTKGTPSGGKTEWRYSLNGQSIVQKTAIQLTGSIRVSKVIDTLALTLQPTIADFSSITIKPQVANPTLSPVAVPSVSGVEALIFSKISIALDCALSPSDTTLTGLEPVLDAPTIGFNRARPQDSTKNPLIFEADMGQTGRILYLDSQYAAEQGGTMCTALDLAVDLGLDGTKPVTVQNVANSGQSLTLTISAQPDFVLSKAVVNPDVLGLNDSLQGDFPEGAGFDLSSINNLAEGMLDMSRVSFTAINLHLYLDTSDLSPDMVKNMRMILSAQYGGQTYALTEPEGDAFNPDAQLFDAAAHGITADNTVYEGPLPPPALTTNMTETFNARPADLSLHYEMKLADHFTVAFDEKTGTGAISADIVIAVPFALDFEPVETDPPDFVILDILNDKLGFGADSQDIFGRSEPDSPISDYLDFIDSSSLTLRYNNTVGLDGATLFIARMDGQGEPLSFTFTSGQTPQTLSRAIAPDFPDYPFVPSFTIGLPRENGKGKLVLKQGANTGIVLKGIEILIKTALDYRITL
ncbi:MAG: hypothetical protein LBO67_07195 [Spirochaetaceae bacterium]|jgi:hypothetical protein|nr:hypothetical protein [Spirochaetaceae bacterium]